MGNCDSLQTRSKKFSNLYLYNDTINENRFSAQSSTTLSNISNYLNKDA